MDEQERVVDARRGVAQRFFLWCAGADRDLLDRLPGFEATKQAGFGTLVLIPAVLALFAMTYALSTLDARPWVYGAGGVLWAAIVFCFDRFLVSSFRKSDSVADDVTSAVFVSRLLLAGFVGMVVAHPLVLLYFDDSIEARLDADRRSRAAAVRADYSERQVALDRPIGTIETQLRRLERQRDDYRARLVDEIDGVVSGRTTGIAGRGASAAEKKLQLERAEEELASARRRGLARIEALRAEQAAIAAQGREAVRTQRQARDYLARVGALEALAAESPHVDRIQWFLILFFVFVDVLPILFKGLTPAGPYDERLRLSEFEVTSRVRARRARLERGPVDAPGYEVALGPAAD